jgi:hypothetical protein
MRICKIDIANGVYGMGGPSTAVGFGFTSGNQSLPGLISVNSPNGAGGSAPIAAGSGIMGGVFGFSTGVTNGVRDDGKPLGYGCGDAKTDGKVPDQVLGRDLTQACVNHDIGYSTCGVTKSVADAKLGSDVNGLMGGGILGAVVGAAYQAGVSLFGQSAYDRAQTEAGCRSSGNQGGNNNSNGSTVGGNGGNSGGNFGGGFGSGGDGGDGGGDGGGGD